MGFSLCTFLPIGGRDEPHPSRISLVRIAHCLDRGYRNRQESCSKVVSSTCLMMLGQACRIKTSTVSTELQTGIRQSEQ